MRKTIQTKLHDPPKVRGNCFATALSCFLDCEIDDIPAFEDIMHKKGGNGEDSWVTTCIKFLNSKGWEWGSLDGHSDGYYMVIGKTNRSDAYHVCIYKDGELYHDPHPDQSGLITEEHFEYLKYVGDQ